MNGIGSGSITYTTLTSSLATLLLLLQLHTNGVRSFSPSSSVLLPSLLPRFEHATTIQSSSSSSSSLSSPNPILLLQQQQQRRRRHRRRNNSKEYATTTTTAVYQSTSSDDSSDDDDVPDMSRVGFVLLAGGTGSRMKANMPKQFMELRGSPVLHYSLDLFLEKLPAFCESHGVGGPPLVVLVLDPTYHQTYQPILSRYPNRLAFANPGSERQFSVQSGLQTLRTLNPSLTHVAIHDSARPLVTIPEIVSVVRDALQHDAAVLGVPCKATIKESADGGKTVLRTVPRERLWEVHTPQVIDIEVLVEGFRKVEEEGLEVTDDVSVVEGLRGEGSVRLTRGEYTNLKITTPEDMDVAGAILEDRGEGGELDLLLGE